MFDPMVDKVVSWCKGEPVKSFSGNSRISCLCFSGRRDGTTTVIICCTAMIPIYERLKIKKIYLATLIILQNCIMNLIPWGGPTARRHVCHESGRRREFRTVGAWNGFICCLCNRRFLLPGIKGEKAPGHQQGCGEPRGKGGAV